ncbi:MAG: hypothetical protein DRJ63_00955 [Thermoprotei archaeon]|nr:MAG: hypothetical protein DRJ63_00955 [Thermoprotei archaeon]
MVKCSECMFFEEIYEGTGNCLKKKVYILQPDRERDCEFFVPRDVTREDFYDRVIPLILKEKRRGAKRSLFDRFKKFLSKYGKERGK